MRQIPITDEWRETIIRAIKDNFQSWKPESVLDAIVVEYIWWSTPELEERDTIPMCELFEACDKCPLLDNTWCMSVGENTWRMSAYNCEAGDEIIGKIKDFITAKYWEEVNSQG